MEKIPIENNDATLSEDAVVPVTTTDAPPSEGCDGSGSSINNKHTKRGRYGRAPPSSQAKRRLEAMATGIDEPSLIKFCKCKTTSMHCFASMGNNL